MISKQKKHVVFTITQPNPYSSADSKDAIPPDNTTTQKRTNRNATKNNHPPAPTTNTKKPDPETETGKRTIFQALELIFG